MANSEKLEIINAEGLVLDARLELPLSQKPRAYAIFAHCFTCNKNFTAVRNISKALNAKGIAVVRFDFTGLGRSEGDFADTNFTSNISDLVAVADHLKEHYEAPSLMVGHSLGGTAALFASANLDSIKTVATIGSPSMPEHVAHIFGDAEEQIIKEGQAQIKIGLQEITVKKQFLDDIKSQDLKEILKRSKRAYLVLHSPQDNIVGIKNASELYHILDHPKSFVSLDGADHMLSDKKDSLYVGDLIASWAQRYLPVENADPLRTDHQVSVRLHRDDNFTTDIRFGEHTFVADEPASVGGADLGPSPYELVSSGLASCTAMTMHMYARRKNWELEEVIVEVDHGKQHASDCKDCETPSNKIDVFERNISIKGELDEKQIARLLEIADKCPVHKTFSSEIEVRTQLKDHFF